MPDGSVFTRIADPLRQLLARLSEYPWWQVAIELVILWVLVFLVYRFIRGTRAAGAVKGLLLVFILATLAVRVFAQGDLFARLAVLYNRLLGLAALAVLITFAPEIRRAVMRLGEASFFRATPEQVRTVVDALVSSCEFLSKNKFGAIIALERSATLRELIETGRMINADVSPQLLNAIFWPNSPLHDMGVVIRGDKIVAASVQFPLADPADMPGKHLGTRHRAAVGMARATDALVIVVSEETGGISIADAREFKRMLTPEALRQELIKRMSSGEQKAKPARNGKKKHRPEPQPPVAETDEPARGTLTDDTQDNEAIRGASNG